MRLLATDVVAVATVAIAATVAAGAELHVATDGADTNPGTREAPFATLARARDAVRQLRAGHAPHQPVTVLVRGGIYPLSDTLTLDAEDSGTDTAPIVYQASRGENAILSGCRSIAGWKPYKDAILEADLTGQGFEGTLFQQLFYNGARQTLARHPNFDPTHPVTGGWAYTDGAPIPAGTYIPGDSRRTLRYRPGDVHDWTHPEGAEAVLFPRYNWSNNILPVAAIDHATRTITLAADASYANRPGDRYYLRNVLEELDEPGEWYVDPRTRTLYFWPPQGLSGATVAAPVLETLIQMTGAQHVTWRGFTFECAERSAVILQACARCLAAANTIRNVGGRCQADSAAITITGGSGNGAVGNDISEVGSNGILLNGGDPATLAAAGNYADNNYIHHTGVIYKQGVGVSVDGVGNRVSHNLIHDCPRFGISWRGNDHAIEFNHIRHCSLETADTGAIYSWQVDWAKRGTQIRYNYLHDVIGFGQEGGKWVYPHMNWGIYLDDGTCGTHVYGNIIARTVLGGVHVHGGRDNLIENNIIVDGRDNQVEYTGYSARMRPTPAILENWSKFAGTPAYAKYAGYAEVVRSPETAWQMAGNKFLRNIVSYTDREATVLRYHSLPFDKTESDRNLLWHFGGTLRIGRVFSNGTVGPNLMTDQGFEQGAPGSMPPGWKWQIRPDGSAAAIDAGVRFAGRQSLRINGRGAATGADRSILQPSLLSTEVVIQPGRIYRLAARIKAAAPNTAFAMSPQSDVPDPRPSSSRMNGVAGTGWNAFERVFTSPALRKRGAQQKQQRTIRIRFDILQNAGTLWIDELKLQEDEGSVVDKWETWRAQGLDLHSIVADPKFRDRARDDFRLEPESPALALGFQPIPVEKIGPYQDDLRATWPIVEARGAREQMAVGW